MPGLIFATEDVHESLEENMPMLNIQVLGATNCANCDRLERIVKGIIVQMGLDAEVRKVTDYATILGYGVMATPGLVINEKLCSAGRIPAPGEITTWLADALEA